MLKQLWSYSTRSKQPIRTRRESISSSTMPGTTRTRNYRPIYEREAVVSKSIGSRLIPPTSTSLNGSGISSRNTSSGQNADRRSKSSKPTYGTSSSTLETMKPGSGKSLGLSCICCRLSEIYFRLPEKPKSNFLKVYVDCMKRLILVLVQWRQPTYVASDRTQAPAAYPPALCRSICEYHCGGPWFVYSGHYLARPDWR